MRWVVQDDFMRRTQQEAHLIALATGVLPMAKKPMFGKGKPKEPDADDKKRKGGKSKGKGKGGKC